MWSPIFTAYSRFLVVAGGTVAKQPFYHFPVLRGKAANLFAQSVEVFGALFAGQNIVRADVQNSAQVDQIIDSDCLVSSLQI